MARPYNNRLGETNINIQELSMEIINYESSTNIDVKFKDGYISKGRTYQEFKNGMIMNKNIGGKLIKNNRLGEEKINSQGCLMKIIRYKNHSNMDILFEDGTIIENISTKHFNDGIIRNPNYRSVYGVGYMGVGKYKPSENIKSYNAWTNVIERCYCKKLKDKRKTYAECSVSEEWHNYQNFAKWYEDNLWDKNICTDVDKDILIKGNKLYSPETCILVGDRLNSLFIKCNSARGKYPIGVSYHKRDEKYYSQCCYINEENEMKTKWLGYCSTESEAFNNYKNFKESYIKQVADQYKQKYPNFPQKLYDAMYSYEVEITD